MAELIKQLKLLYDRELYSNIVRVCDLAFTLSEQKPDYFSLLAKFQVNLYYADSLFYTEQYLQAENLYRQMLQLRKSIISKSKNTNNKIIENQNELTSDLEIKYQIYLCCTAQNQKDAALETLLSIAARQRTSKINMALGKLFRKTGKERSAISCFKEVLRECPLALDAVENLLQMGISGVEVNSLVLDSCSELSWLSSWIKAQAQLHGKEYTNAIQTYRSMDTHGLLKDNTSLTVNMAYCFHYLGDDNRAIALLQKAVRIEPNLVFGRDLLSTLFAASGITEHQSALENLISSIEDRTLWKAEHWVVLGNVMYCQKKLDKALYYGHKACVMDVGNIEAYLLKANSFMQLKKYQEAASHCTEALQKCPFRFEIHKCLVESYVQMNRFREAEGMALNACKELNYSPQANCLHASVLLKDPMASMKIVKKILERAVSQDKNGHTNALFMLVEILDREQQYEAALQLLLKALETQKPSSKVHQLIGDCYVNLQKDEDAFNHYNVALNLDPQNQRAAEGLNNIGRTFSVISKRDQYSAGGEETQYNSRRSNSDHEADPESDSDLWPGWTP